MKRFTILGASLLTIAAIQAQNPVSPVILQNWGVNGISPNGQYVGGISFDAKVYNLATGQSQTLPGMNFGIGNFVSNKGGAVGNTENDNALVYLNGKTFAPASLAGFWFCDINGISGDQTRLCGVINPPEGLENSLDYVPFYCDIAEDGTVGEPVILPYPYEDFTGSINSFASALWISNDGKTILGDVIDRYGYYDSPIIYTQDDNGEWSYSLPTAKYLNPDHVEFPPNPWIDEPPYPEETNFMSPLERAAYEKALEDMIYTGIIPDAKDYMTDEEWEAYYEAYETYNEWYYAKRPEIIAYQQLYNSVLEDSYAFPFNELALSPDGTKFVSTSSRAIKGGTLDQVIGEEYFIYMKDLVEGTDSFIPSLSEWIQPTQVFDNGTITAAYPINPINSGLPTDSFIIPAGSEEMMSMLDYWQEYNPAYAEWIEGNITNGVGFVLTNSDLSLFLGAVDDFNMMKGMDVATYIFGIDNAGVEAITIEDASNYKVYNLQGVNVMNTTDKNELSNLPAGLYIINGKKTLISK